MKNVPFYDAISSFSGRPRPQFLDSDRADSWQDRMVEWASSQDEPIESDSDTLSSWRVLFLWVAVVAAFVLLEGRSIYVMLVQSSKYSVQAQENRILVRRVVAPRGVISDRNGMALSKNIAAYRVKKGDNYEFVDRETALLLEATRSAEVVVDSVRTYPFNTLFAHLVGYTSEVTKEELESDAYRDYRPGDRVGRGGVEETYESHLRGDDGRELVEVNVEGEEIRKLSQEDASPGSNLRLTVDSELQRIAYQALEKTIREKDLRAGVVVVTDPENGDVLSMVSVPSFNPNLFIEGDQDELQSVLEDRRFPLVNRAIAGVYPPGSTVKIAVAAAALEAGVITPETIIEDTGVISLGPYTFSNWYYTQYGRTEGPVDVRTAIYRSNDIFFYRVGERMGVERLGSWLREFGLASRTGIELPSEAAGLVGSDEWKQKNIGQPWYPGDTLHMAIGQGFLQSTPLQINLITGYFANGGVLREPRLVKTVIEPDGDEIPIVPRERRSGVVGKEHMALVKEAMGATCTEGGTGWPFFDFPVEVGCKTGTAEVGNADEDTHAWFTLFAPYQDPEVVVTVLLEEGGEGSTDAAPVAKAILSEWLL